MRFHCWEWRRYVQFVGAQTSLWRLRTLWLVLADCSEPFVINKQHSMSGASLFERHQQILLHTVSSAAVCNRASVVRESLSAFQKALCFTVVKLGGTQRI
jgi:hypothetical protein